MSAYFTTFITGFHSVKMPSKVRKDCPVCGKPDLTYLSDHLRQVHQLQRQIAQAS